MFKVPPNPPDTDPASPYESPDSKQFHEAAERALDYYLNPGPKIMANDLVDHLEGTSRNALLGMAQVIMLGELAVKALTCGEGACSRWAAKRPQNRLSR